jgi:lauroyl/myristoyl acyltransferase
MALPLKQFRYRIEWLAIKFLKATVPLLPRKGILLLANTLGTLAYHADAEGRRTALANLATVFGKTHSEDERRAIAKQAYCSFARTMLDQFWSSRLTVDNYLNYVEPEIEDEEALERARESGAIWVTPHYGNFEWMSLTMGLRGFPFTIIAQDFKNPLLTELFKANRKIGGHQVIPQRGAMLRLLKNLKAGGHAAFLTDLTIKPGRSATVIDCFGLRTCVTALHANLRRKTQQAIIPGISIPLPNGNYRVHAFAPLELDENASNQEIAQACWDVFEAYIRENPAPWLWMYKHWRYRPKTNGERYPAYAKASSRFNKLEKGLAEAAGSKDGG